MPHAYTPVDAFTSPVNGPSDGDALDEASVDDAFQALTDRTHRLGILLDGATGDRIIFIGPHRNSGGNGWGIDAGGAGGDLPAVHSDRITCTENASPIFIDISEDLPNGAKLKLVRALVKPGASRAGANRMQMFVSRSAMATGFAGPAAPAETQIGTTGDDGGAAVAAIITSGAMTEIIARQTNRIHVQINSGNTAHTDSDEFYGLEITIGEP